MSTIKAIEGRSVHQIQSGQVIVDLCSVVKELVENSLDAGATSIDVRFKAQGLESIEVQDNGAGILPDDYETIALKHYTSKLSSYDDLSSLDTFGFRGEALSSLCALSHFHILTARENEAPKGTRLDFETSGKLKDTTVAACPRGTAVAVEGLFYNLPVRRRELEKNIKREYGKVLGILHAYACISTGVRLSVSNQVTKGKKVVVFSTNSNPSTRQNISNVFGAKTLLALIPMSLDLELQPTTTTTRILKDTNHQTEADSRKVQLVGHVSRPVFGEGRQTPDRQMFFVNSRPCALPQVSKAFNEVYKSYNITQSPFIFANLKMNTNAYDVNVSPDKRTILLHDQAALLETLKESLNQLFEAQDQTVPQSQLPGTHLPSFRPVTIRREAATSSNDDTPSEPANQDDGLPHLPTTIPSEHDGEVNTSDPSSVLSQDHHLTTLIHNFVERNVSERKPFKIPSVPEDRINQQLHRAQNSTRRRISISPGSDVAETPSQADVAQDEPLVKQPRPVQDFNARLASQEAKSKEAQFEIPTITAPSAKSSDGSFQSAFDMMRTNRQTHETDTFTKGRRPSPPMLEPPSGKRRKVDFSSGVAERPVARPQFSRFAKRVHVYAAPGTQPDEDSRATSEEIVDESDENENLLERGESESSVNDVEGSESDTHLNSQAHSGDISEENSEAEFIDETERKKRDQAKIEEMVRRAEQAAARPAQEQKKRATAILQSSAHKDSTLSLVTVLETSVQKIDKQLVELEKSLAALAEQTNLSSETQDAMSSKVSAEERLSLTIAKSDFGKMRIIGQFNLGFILATRPSNGKTTSDDLFIIDQHASDEIYNFSRLSATTTLNPQPLVRPHPLELTAIEEETILNHTAALAKNGFTIAVDESGAAPVGRRCHLLTLPTSRETVFDTRDLEELIALLGDAPSGPSAPIAVTRPSKVRKMLAMRACRSSIMVGRPLTLPGMNTVVRHMGEIDRPWNCPHGRPTMRHLAGLGEWSGWEEGDGLVDDADGGAGRDETDWWVYLKGARESGLLDSTVEEDDGAMEGTIGEVDEEESDDSNDDSGDDDDDDSLDDANEQASA